MVSTTDNLDEIIKKNQKEDSNPITQREIDPRLKNHIEKLLLQVKFNQELQNPITELSTFHFSQKHINV